MKTFEFKLPDIGEGVTEGEIVKWLISPGDRVAEDQPIVEVMTDKATVTITAPWSGEVVETRGAVGSIVPVHSVLVVFNLGEGDSPGRSTPRKHAASPAGSEGAAATAVGDIKEHLPGMDLMGRAPALKEANGGTHAASGYFNPKPLATPATRKFARDHGVDLRNVPPTGPNGRVTRDDVEVVTGHASHAAEPDVDSHAPAPELPQGAQAKAPSSDALLRAEEERIPLRGLRKRIFEGMTRSKHTAAHFTFVEECDATALLTLRDRLRPSAEKAGVKLTFLPFFVKAAVAALRKHPMLNATFDEATQEIVIRKHYDIGIASATPQGLIVPVVRAADRKSILGIAKDIARLGEDARAGKSQKEDLGGSTFTITSLGPHGGLFATPILNFPEVAILGVHRIKQKPVVMDGQIVIGNVMLLSLSFDHRIIDGQVGAYFAYELISYLEDPDRLFLEMA